MPKQAEYEFPYFWHGAWKSSLALKMQSVYVWFKRELDEETRAAIVNCAPTPMRDAAWHGPVLVLMNFGNIEIDLPRDYGKPRKRAVTSFTEALDRWILEAHSIANIRMASNHVGDGGDPWHRWSLRAFQSSVAPAFADWFLDKNAGPRSAEADERIAVIMRNTLRALDETESISSLDSQCVSQLLPALTAGIHAVPLLARELEGYAKRIRATVDGGGPN